jgi:hypothetical protein
LTKRVCIIGAGPSGLAQLRAFQSAAEKGAEIPEIVCYEKQPDWGGLWRYDWRTGVDEHCNPCHGSMYRYLWSNGPKEGLEFADYTFEEHFGKPIASYPPRAVLFDYIEGRVNKADVRKFCKFNHIVRDVRAVDGGFEVSARDGVSDSEERSVFDHVIVSTGHFSFPNVPHYPGFESFNGRILHAHDFRDAREFEGKDAGARADIRDALVGGNEGGHGPGAEPFVSQDRAKPVPLRTHRLKEVSPRMGVPRRKGPAKEGVIAVGDGVILHTFGGQRPGLTPGALIGQVEAIGDVGAFAAIAEHAGFAQEGEMSRYPRLRHAEDIHEFADDQFFLSE